LFEFLWILLKYELFCNQSSSITTSIAAGPVSVTVWPKHMEANLWKTVAVRTVEEIINTSKNDRQGYQDLYFWNCCLECCKDIDYRSDILQQIISRSTQVWHYMISKNLTECITRTLSFISFSRLGKKKSQKVIANVAWI